jgi:hypothetical protein
MLLPPKVKPTSKIIMSKPNIVIDILGTYSLNIIYTIANKISFQKENCRQEVGKGVKQNNKQEPP